MAKRRLIELSDADQLRLKNLRRMQAVAIGALIFMALLFALSFWLQQSQPAWAYVRAAAEGGLVGGLADWFAVTALFRRPLGLPIPHTAIIPTRKDEIGQSLGEFVETNFLSGDVVRSKLESTALASKLGEWVREPEHAERVVAELSTAASAVLNALSDDDVQDLISDLARDHLVNADWATPAGEWLERVVAADAHAGAVDMAIDTIAKWLVANEGAFSGLVSQRLPGWVPKLAHRFVDDAAYNEALKFVLAVQADPNHQARKAVDGYLDRLAAALQSDPALRARLDGAKDSLFDSPRVAELAASAWTAAKTGLLKALDDAKSGLRTRATAMLTDIGDRLVTDDTLQARVDGWITDAAVFVVDRYRHDIASIITDTIDKWDAAETTEKIELMVGRDLQYIRLNGTFVGALAGLLIYSVAHALLG